VHAEFSAEAVGQHRISEQAIAAGIRKHKAFGERAVRNAFAYVALKDLIRAVCVHGIGIIEHAHHLSDFGAVAFFHLSHRKRFVHLSGSFLKQKG
jgi:hypothetical protein